MEVAAICSIDDVLEALAVEMGDVSHASRSGQQLERPGRP